MLRADEGAMGGMHGVERMTSWGVVSRECAWGKEWKSGQNEMKE